MDPWVQEGRRAWREASDFRDLCDLGARFLKGELGYFPGWGAAETDEESDGVQWTLVNLNRAGFLTVASGRGEPARAGEDGRPEHRRPFVLGFASGAVLDELRGLGDGILMRDFGARERGGQSLPVGRRGDDVFLQVGAGAGEQELKIFADALHGQALRDLEQQRYVVLVGLDWGQDAPFWRALADATLGTNREDA